MQALRFRRFAAVVVVAVSGSLAFVATSEASTATYTLDTPESRVDIGGDVDADLVVLSLTATSVRIVDTGPGGITGVAPCSNVNATTVDCPLTPVAPNGPLGQISASLGADADSLASTVPNFLLVQGDGGGDTLAASGVSDAFFLGGQGNDTLVGGDGDDFLDGGQDEDSLSGGAGDDEVDGDLGSDSVSGGEGADRLFDGGAPVPGEPATGADSLDGGPGQDSTTYFRDENLSLSLNGVADDGEAGEADNLIGVESIAGGEGDDVISGDSSQNMLDGGDAGNDILTGGGGGDLLSGGVGDDSLIGAQGPDALECGFGFDTALVDPDDDVDPLCDRIGASLTADTVRLNKKGAGAVAVSCRIEEAAPCAGTLTVVASGRTLGTGTFEVAAGATSNAGFKLSKQGLKKLAKAGNSLFATVEARTTEPGGVSLDTEQALLEGKAKKPKKGGGKKGGNGGKGPKA